MLSIDSALKWTVDELERARIPSARSEAEWLLSNVLAFRRSDLYLHRNAHLSSPQHQRLKELVARRQERIPLQHLIGETEFFSLSFKVTRDVLIPRPETEILVEAVVHRLLDTSRPKILDLGTGSGIVGISVGHALIGSRVVATDISRPTLDIASSNAQFNGTASRTLFAQADLLSCFRPGSFDAILSNPPYVSTGQFASLQPEVRDHDPRSALDGGEDGMDFHRRILEAAPQLLTPGGWLFVEIGGDQGVAIRQLAETSRDLAVIDILQDLARRDRVFIGRRRN